MTEPLDLETLAERAGIRPAFIEAVEANGVLDRRDGRFAGSDVYPVRLLGACERAGLRIEAIEPKGLSAEPLFEVTRVA